VPLIVATVSVAISPMARAIPLALTEPESISNSPEVLVKLSRQLFDAGVLPYYLHLLDPVAGAQHFDVPEVEGVNLIRQISGQLPGYLVPRLAREIPGADAKQVIAGQ
jgi:L-lysine 2,3-aminomutase